MSKRRNHTRQELMAQRAADDKRRKTQERVTPTKRSEAIYSPAVPMLYNPFKSRSRGGIILITPGK